MSASGTTPGPDQDPSHRRSRSEAIGGETSSRDARTEPRRIGVSPWWRIATITLVVIVVAIGLSITAFKPSPSTETLTAVEWSRYAIPGGPAEQENFTNNTEIPGWTYCTPYDALTVGLFTMVWATSTAHPVQRVALWAMYPPNSTYPLGYPVTLYGASNEASGGTGFLSLYPAPCTYTWTITVESSEPVVVYVVATFTYNYTS